MREGLLLVAKTLATLLGIVLLMAALVELSVAGPTPRGLGALGAGLLLAVPPFAFAFRDAVRAARSRGSKKKE